MRILIVDDDEGDRYQIKRALKQAEVVCECSEARDMNEAVNACASSAFACAIVDYRLPGCDGLAALSALHNLYPSMPIVMSTGEGDELVAAEAMRRGACDYIPKATLNAQSMRRAIETALGKVGSEKAARQQTYELEKSLQFLEAALGLIAHMIEKE